jgi:Protein of unknown function (DUF4038)/Putative collagen-binding domain of a collagenase
MAFCAPQRVRDGKRFDANCANDRELGPGFEATRGASWNGRFPLHRRPWSWYKDAVKHTDLKRKFGMLAVLLAASRALPGGAAGPVFPLKVSENRRYLVDQRGEPFFVLGDTPWFLQKRRIEDVRRIMDDRKAKGFNTLFLEILDDSAMPSRDAYGQVAFQPEKEIAKPVEAYWRYADTVLDEAARRGFFVIMSDLWFGAGGGLWMHHVTPGSARTYGHFLGKRYARFINLMWMQCGDRNPDARLAECTRELARALRAEAPEQLQTAHLAHEFASASFFHAEKWLDVNMAYTYAASYLQVAKEYARTDPVRPVILGETGYEGEPNAIELLPDAKRGDLWTPYRIRRNAWWAVLSGACGYCGGTRLWRFEKNWPAVLEARSTRQAPLLLRLFEGRPWWRLVPDVKHELVTAGYGVWKEADYVCAARANEGSLAVAYVPRSPQTLTVDLTKLSGVIQARWFDPASGDFLGVSGSPIPAVGSRDFTTPRSKAHRDGDWVLVLEAEKSR